MNITNKVILATMLSISFSGQIKTMESPEYVISSSLNQNVADRNYMALINNELYNAARSGKSTKVLELIAIGADVFSRHGENKFPVTAAAISGGTLDSVIHGTIKIGSWSDCQKLHKENRISIPLVKCIGFSLLLGKVAIAKNFLGLGVPQDQQVTVNGYTTTLLCLAACNANVNTEDSYGKIAQKLITANKNVHAVDQHKTTPLMHAASTGNLNLVQKLLNSGADVNAIDEMGVTALIFAVDEGHSAIVQMLLLSGADPMVKDAEGKDALFYAEGIENKDIKCMLQGAINRKKILMQYK